MKMRFFGRFAAIVCVVGTLGTAQGDPFTIMTGTDYFKTVAPTNVNFGGTLGLGVVDLCGDPLGGAVGDTDTIVRRKANADLSTGTGTIGIELVALNLVSCQPITIGGNFYDLQVNQAPGTQQTGSMTIHKTHANGGTFDSFLPVRATMTFTQVSNPLNFWHLDATFNFNTTGALWDTRHSPGTMLVSGLYGNTVANNHTNPPSDSVFDVFYEIPFTNSSLNPNANHTVVSATPEPVTSALALGAFAAAAFRRRKAQG